MHKLSVAKIVELIKSNKVFEAETPDGSMYIRIDRYVPYVCTAIHDGCNIRQDLEEKCALSPFERWYEEDPYTGEFISALPIVLVGRDSRFEYDLNRSPDQAIYEQAWGKKVWNRPLGKVQKQKSLVKHDNYYKITHALIEQLEYTYNGCVVYDIHSYNYKRWERPVPVFNIGTERINAKFKSHTEEWNKRLSCIKLEHSNVTIDSKINDTFHGRGYNLEYITKHFSKTLVLATEVKKIYCDEETGEDYPQIIKELKIEFKKAILDNANLFAQNFTNWSLTKNNKLLPKSLDNTVKKVDRKLFKLVKDFELLNFVNPINLEKEKKRFFKSNFTENPEFNYKPIQVDPFLLKRQLHNLDLETINDISIQNMYEATVNGYIDKIEMMAALGTSKFLYNSLRYFGKPTPSDLKNATYLLHLPSLPHEEKAQNTILKNQAIDLLKENLQEYGFKSSIGVSKKMVASMMVLNRQQKVLVNDKLNLPIRQFKGLMHHEVGVHMVTTINSNLQPLKIFNVGLPVNTMTQEGLAVMAEYWSGNLTLQRLKTLAYRTIAINEMCNGEDFKSVFTKLTTEYKLNQDSAFTITTRVFRGGGFTKDYLYLRGLRKILEYWNSGKDLSPLLIGKTSLKFYNTIVEMLERGLILPPQHITSCYLNPKTQNDTQVFNYILSGIK